MTHALPPDRESGSQRVELVPIRMTAKNVATRLLRFEWSGRFGVAIAVGYGACCIPAQTVALEAPQEARLGAVEDGLSPEQQLRSALTYLNGDGVAIDQTKAFALLRRAAERGLPQAQSALGVAYAKGVGAPVDGRLAVSWFRKAALNGLAEGQLNLGLAYVNGLSVERDPAEAVKWFLLAALQGNAEAEFDLGIAYGRGDGVQMNPAESRRWISLAAKHGLPRAQRLLDSMKSVNARP